MILLLSNIFLMYWICHITDPNTNTVSITVKYINFLFWSYISSQYYHVQFDVQYIFYLVSRSRIYYVLLSLSSVLPIFCGPVNPLSAIMDLYPISSVQSHYFYLNALQNYIVSLYYSNNNNSNNSNNNNSNSIDIDIDI